MPRIVLVSHRPEEAFSSLSNQVLQSDKGYPDILYDGRSYRSAEHLFRALRYPSHSPYHKDVRNAATVAEAIAYVPKYAFSERLWRTRNRLVPGSQDWAMDVVLEAKFDMAANLPLCEKLMRTQDAIIINDDANDPIWGVGKNGRGDNLLGVRLMCVVCGLDAAVKAKQSS